MLRVKLDYCDDKENEEVIKAFVDKLNDMFENIENCSGKSLNEAELFVSENMRELRQVMLELRASIEASTKETEPKSLPKSDEE